MNFICHSHRHAETILVTDKYSRAWHELKQAISSITDTELIAKHEEGRDMSLSKAINTLLKEKLIALHWDSESEIFQDDAYSDNRWRLDFAKDFISVEVAFNHGEAIAWNLLKPVLASELNHVRKAIQTELGVIICATEELKEAGAFDSSVGHYEKFLTYLTPLQDVLTVPVVIIGLKAPSTFRVEKEMGANRRNRGIIRHF